MLKLKQNTFNTYITKHVNSSTKVILSLIHIILPYALIVHVNLGYSVRLTRLLSYLNIIQNIIYCIMCI